MNTINDMQNRRDFLKTAAFAALGSGMAINSGCGACFVQYQ